MAAADPAGCARGVVGQCDHVGHVVARDVEKFHHSEISLVRYNTYHIILLCIQYTFINHNSRVVSIFYLPVI